jgi:hypothetical protein
MLEILASTPIEHFPRKRNPDLSSSVFREGGIPATDTGVEVDHTCIL